MKAKLLQCRKIGEAVGDAAHTLGARWVRGRALVAASERFVAECKEWSENRKVSTMTIAFVGPTKAGKTTLLSLLIRNSEKSKDLPIGHLDGTEKVTWIGPSYPEVRDCRHETVIECSAGDLEDIGTAWTLIDVPGADDALPARRAAATKALNWARVKVLVVPERQIRSRDYRSYLAHCQGATVLPVVNLVSGKGLSEDLIEAFSSAVQRAAGTYKVLSVVQVPDWKDEEFGRGRQEWENDTRRQLAVHLGEAVRSVDTDRELEAKLRAFRSELGHFLDSHLSGSAQAMRDLKDEEAALPAKLTKAYFDQEESFKAGLRRKMRLRYLSATPRWAFPWRSFLGLASLIEGALERAVFASMGSLPSTIQLLFTAGRNQSTDLTFDRKLLDLCTARMEDVAARQLKPAVRTLQAALWKDLAGDDHSPPCRPDNLKVSVEGIGAAVACLQAEVEVRVAADAPSSQWAFRHALIGTVIFGALFAWPVLALYGSYWSAWWTFDLASYPVGVWSAIITAFVVSVLPMCVWMVASNAVLFCSGRVDECFAKLLRQASRKESELTDSLTVSIDQPEVKALDALRRIAEEKTDEAVEPADEKEAEPADPGGDGEGPEIMKTGNGESPRVEAGLGIHRN